MTVAVAVAIEQASKYLIKSITKAEQKCSAFVMQKNVIAEIVKIQLDTSF